MTSRLLRLFLLVAAVTSSVVKAAPCAPTTAAPCGTTTAAMAEPCEPKTTTAALNPCTTTTTTLVPCEITTAAMAQPCSTTTTTTTPVPCETTTAAMAEPCEPKKTTVAHNPCPTTTITPVPCETTTAAMAEPCSTTTTTTTTPVPCETTTAAMEEPCEPETTTVALNPCATTAPVPCETTTAAMAQPCSTTTTTTTAVPCAITTTAYSPCGTEGPVIEPELPQTPPPNPFGEVRCRDGWTRFEDSCYYVAREQKKSFWEAEEHCLSLRSTLFVANSEEEFKTLFHNGPLNTWTWIGMNKLNEEEAVHWDFDEALDHTKLNWLNNSPYGDGINGWTSFSQCAAHWNPSIGKYVFWYPCDYSFHYICEYNSTIFLR